MKHIRRKVPLRAKADRYEFETMREFYMWSHRQFYVGYSLKEMRTDWFLLSHKELPFSWSATNLNIRKTFDFNKRNVFPLTLKSWSNKSK